MRALASCLLLLLVPPTLAAEAPPPDLLPHSAATTGTRDIVRAWLAEPTARYAHGVLGDGLEASALRVETAEGRTLTLRLPGDQVFEDLTPRLADLDGDGRDEVLVVRADAQAGAALAVHGLRAGRLTELAATPPIGTPHRWLNPVGAADLDGDGRMEVALVRTPHIGGVLEIWEWRDGGLHREATAGDVSNHAMGSPVLALHAIADLTGDGRPDLLLPDQRRTTLRLLTLTDGALAEARSVPLAAPVAGAMTVSEAGVQVPLADGSVHNVGLLH